MFIDSFRLFSWQNLLFFQLPPSVSSLVAQRSNRTGSRKEAFFLGLPLSSSGSISLSIL